MGLAIPKISSGVRLGLQAKFILLVVVLLAMAAANIATFHIMLRQLDGVAQTVDMAGRLRVLSQMTAFEVFVDSSNGFESLRRTIHSFEQILDVLEGNQSGGIALRRIAPDSLPTLKSMRIKWDLFKSNLTAISGQQQTLATAAVGIEESSRELLRDAQSLVDALTRGSQRIHDRATLTLYTLFTVEFFVLLVLLYTTRKRFVDPLRKLAELNMKLSKGSFGSYDGIIPNDEIGELAVTFNFASQEIRALIEKNKKDNAALAQSVAMFRGLADNSLMGVYILQENLEFFFTNRTLAEMFRFDELEFANISMLDLIHERDHEAIRNNTHMRLAGKSDRAVYEVLAYRRDGTQMDVEIFASVMDLHGKRALIGTIVDITERKQYQRQCQIEYLEQLQHQASFDELTGLANRNQFLDKLRQATSQARRANALAGVLLIDLDDFKIINDSLGHGAGDDLLKAVAQRLRSILRDNDTIARLGGDEFAILLPRIVDTREAASVADKVLTALNQSFIIQTREIYVGASIGVSLFPDGDQDYLLRNADLAMYHAKRQGGRRFHFYSEELDVQNQRHMTLEAELRQAVERGELTLVYQPKVNLKTRQVEGAEALLRWKHPTLGNISPAEFIPIAESTGLIIPIGEWVLRTACLQSKAWQDVGISAFPLAINLSARQFLGEGLVPMITSVLQQTGVSPDCLELELTESVLIQNMGETVSALLELKQMGIRLSLDDFGTCYSSLSYLLQLPFDILKLDISFVRNLSVMPNAGTLTKAIINLSHNLSLKVVAEGIETEEQLLFLDDSGCDIGQGYYFSRPVDAEALLDFLRASEVSTGTCCTPWDKAMQSVPTDWAKAISVPQTTHARPHAEPDKSQSSLDAPVP